MQKLQLVEIFRARKFLDENKTKISQIKSFSV